MPIRCLLADDNPENLTFLKALCSQQGDIEVVGAFMDGMEFYEAQQDLEYEACFLDIDMPGLNGLDLAKLLQGKLVVFVSAHLERAWEAFNIEAVDFIPKPMQRERFGAAVERLRKAIRLEQTSVPGEHAYRFFPTAEGRSRVNTQEIVAIHTCRDPKADKRDKTLVHVNGKQSLLKNISIEALREQFLPRGKFIQINRGTVINVDCPFTMRGRDTLVFDFPDWKHALELTLGRAYEKDFRQQFPGA